MQAVTLDNDSSFSEIVTLCSKFDITEINFKELNASEEEIDLINNFLSYIEKETFKQTIEDNREISNYLNIDLNIVNKRFEYFLENN